jgi:hypothetical protein
VSITSTAIVLAGWWIMTRKKELEIQAKFKASKKIE